MRPEQAAETVATAVKSAIAFIASYPIFADVYIDGKLVGKTNTQIKIPSGAHTMRFVKGDKEITQQMTFHPRKKSNAVCSATVRQAQRDKQKDEG